MVELFSFMVVFSIFVLLLTFDYKRALKVRKEKEKLFELLETINTNIQFISDECRVIDTLK